jgi:hypothetical protein
MEKNTKRVTVIMYEDDCDFISKHENEVTIREDSKPRVKMAATCIDMLSNDYKARFKAEFQQLYYRVEGLKNTLDRYVKGELNFTPKSDIQILDAQLDFMVHYMGTLCARAVAEQLDLDWLIEGLDNDEEIIKLFKNAGKEI